MNYFSKVADVGNKTKAQWEADGLLETCSLDEIKGVIDYYQGVSSAPNWRKFAYGFDDIRNARAAYLKDREDRRRNIERLSRWASE